VALPGDVATTTITGTAVRADGTAAVGAVVSFAMPTWLVDTTSHAAIIPRVFTDVTDSGGTWSIAVIATDQVQISPLNWAYTFTVNDGGVMSDPVAVQVPSTPDPTTFDVLVPTDVVVGTPNLYVPLATRGVAGGVASLGNDGLVPAGQLPAGGGGGVASVTAGDATITVGGTATAPTVKVASTASLLKTQLAAAVQTSLSAADSAYQKPGGGIPSTDMAAAVQTSLGKADTALQAAPVTSVASKTGAVTLVKGDVGLGSVDNTSDVNKPVSTAQSTAITAKYTLPGGGVPKTDLAAAVQTSLGKADTALQVAPTDRWLAPFSAHSAVVPFTSVNAVSTINNEAWFGKVVVRAGSPLATAMAVRTSTVATHNTTGLNGFAIWDAAAANLLWQSASDDLMWESTGVVSKVVTGIATPSVDTTFWIAVSCRGYSAAAEFGFVNLASKAIFGDFYARYKGGGYTTWPASFNPATDLTTGGSFVLPVMIG
jgi:hypothetical protein